MQLCNGKSVGKKVSVLKFTTAKKRTDTKLAGVKKRTDTKLPITNYPNLQGGKNNGRKSNYMYN